MLNPDFIHPKSDLLPLRSNAKDIFSKSEPFLLLLSNTLFQCKAVVQIDCLQID
jgi:hypothetical protein